MSTKDVCWWGDYVLPEYMARDLPEQFHEGRDSMYMSEYHEFVRSMKVFPEKFAIIYPTLGMMGEAGEVSEKVKKWMRGDRELDKAELVKEVGDVLWYITALADDLGYTLEDVAVMNVAKLSDRRDRNVVKGSGDNR